MAAAITTAEQLLKAQDIGRCELVRGEFRKLIPPSFEHGRVAMNLGVLIANHVKELGLGMVVAAETGFLLALDPDTVRAPDVAFVRAERLPGPPRGYFEGAPDLAVEVLSPDDRPGAVRDKVAEWLESGAEEVWVVDPRKRTIAVHNPDSTVLRESASLTSELLPGFELAVREVFA
ncbi:MAG: Uma2 family endonuclease [Planctomycetota bacterium]|jgi:Uma2 family endonuclease